MGKFGSPSIAFRPRPPTTSRPPIRCWNGPFRFFDLPPELRELILNFILLNFDSTGKDITHLFLTCRRIYMEAASIFYYQVRLDNMRLRGTGDPFLAGPLTAVTPRQHVRNLTIRFSMKDQTYLFGEVYINALREMAANGKLQYLRLEIGSHFPSLEFWGHVDESYAYDNILLAAGKGKGREVMAPVFITMKPFQDFLRFLEDSRIPKLRLYIDADDHLKFWCLFHRAHPSGQKCDGDWKGQARLLKVNCANLVKAVLGAQVAGPPREGC